MLSDDNIFQRIAQLEKENELNKNRKEHFSKQWQELDKVEMYDRMIKENEIRIDTLYIVLEIDPEDRL